MQFRKRAAVVSFEAAQRVVIRGLLTCERRRECLDVVAVHLLKGRRQIRRPARVVVLE
jgi:hypothetical protein